MFSTLLEGRQKVLERLREMALKVVEVAQRIEGVDLTLYLTCGPQNREGFLETTLSCRQISLAKMKISQIL